MFVFVKGRGTCVSGERNVKIWIDFRKSPRFSLTSPLCQEREFKSPCFYYVRWATYCLFSLPINSLKEMPTQMCFGNYLSVFGSSVLYFSNHESFVPNHVGPLSSDFFFKWQCTKKLGFKNIFNEEYELYQPKETYEYIFSKYK